MEHKLGSHQSWGNDWCSACSPSSCSLGQYGKASSNRRLIYHSQPVDTSFSQTSQNAKNIIATPELASQRSFFFLIFFRRSFQETKMPKTHPVLGVFLCPKLHLQGWKPKVAEAPHRKCRRSLKVFFLAVFWIPWFFGTNKTCRWGKP